MFSSGRKFDGGGATERRRIVILRSGGNVDDDGFGVAADVNPIDLALACSGEAVERGANRHSHRTGTADACPGGGLGIRREREAALWLKELHNFREKRQPVTFGFDEGREGSKTFFELDIPRDELDAAVARRMRFDYARSVERDRRIHRDRTGMKEIERPDV